MEEKDPTAIEQMAQEAIATPESGEAVEQAVEANEPPRGRAAFMERYRSSNPDAGDDIDDDTLFDYAGQGFDEREERYNSLNSANQKLAEAISQDPRFAQLIAMIANGESLMYSLGKSFGDLLNQLGEGDLEELIRGQEETAGRYKEIEGNFNSYQSRLNEYAKNNDLDEETKEKINDIILDMADAFISHNITDEIIEYAHKALDYDEATEIKTGVEDLALKNKAIDTLRESKRSGSKLPPDLTAGAGVSKPGPAIPNTDDRPKDYFEQLEKVR